MTEFFYSHTHTHSYMYIGILLITLSLCADAIIGNVQEKAMKQYSASTVEIIIFSYSIGILYLLLWTAVSGILVPAFHFCLEVCNITMLLE